MKNDLTNLGKSLGKDAKESDTNTRRISANFPQIERKLDIVSDGFNFKMEIPLKEASTIASLNIYIKPDNCCECDAGGLSSTRRIIGDVTEFADINGNPFMPNQPADSPYNGIDYRGLVTSATTLGVLDSIWFAWPGYPWFYPNGYYYDDFLTNSYGDFNVYNQAIQPPVDGVYIIGYNGLASGTPTATGKITVTLKKASILDLTVWDTMSKEVISVMKGNLEANSSFSRNMKISAVCYGLGWDEIVAVWITAEDINGWSLSNGTIVITLMGEGYGQITGFVYHDGPSNNPIEGASVVLLLPNAQPVLTDALGRYTITNVLPGIHTIQATYSTNPVLSFIQKVFVERNKVTTDVNFIL